MSNPTPEQCSVENAAREFWTSRGRRLCWRINLGWMLDVFSPAAFVALAVFSGLLVTARRMGGPPLWLPIAGAGLFLVAAALCYGKARRRFATRSEALARLDAALGLQTRLSAAAQGVGRWPGAEAWRALPWRWNWSRLALPPAMGLLLVAAAGWIPLSTPQNRVPTVKPPALAEVESWLEKLEETPAIDRASLEPARQQAAELAWQEPAQWYSHPSLEAADHLRGQLALGMQTLEGRTAQISNLLDAASVPMTPAEAAAWQAELGKALSGLEGNLPTLNPELAGQLREIDASRLKPLSPEQIKKLKDGLCKAGGACKKPGAGEGLGDEGELLAVTVEGRGRGGVDRGPGAAPLTFSPETSELGTKKMEALSPADLSRATLGDRVGVSFERPEVNTEASTTAGGAVSTPGNGGSAVWLPQNLAPAERARLQHFFR